MLASSRPQAAAELAGHFQCICIKQTIAAVIVRADGFGPRDEGAVFGLVDAVNARVGHGQDVGPVGAVFDDPVLLRRRAEFPDADEVAACDRLRNGAVVGRFSTGARAGASQARMPIMAETIVAIETTSDRTGWLEMREITVMWRPAGVADQMPNISTFLSVRTALA